MSRAGFLVGVGGGTGAGKSTLVRGLVGLMPPGLVAVLPADAYYCDQRELGFAARTRVNYDHPDALDVDRLVADLKRLRAGREVRRPVYDFQRHVRLRRAEAVKPGPVIVVEGLLILADHRLRELMDLKVFVVAPPETRQRRRERRDVAERGRCAEAVRSQYLATVRPMHERFVEPSRHHADLEIPGWGPRAAAVRLLAGALRDHLPPGSVPPWNSE